MEGYLAKAEEFTDWIMTDKFWLPTNVTWEMYREFGRNNRIVQFSDWWYVVGVALFLAIIRSIANRYIILPIGKSNIPGYKESSSIYYKFLELNPIFKKWDATYIKYIYSGKNKKIFTKYCNKLLKEFESNNNDKGTNDKKDIINIEKLEEWIKLRTAFENKAQILTKFAEASFRFTVYTFCVVLGIRNAYHYDFLFNLDNMWIGYPYHAIKPDALVYCSVELGLYFYLMVNQFFEVRKKDFWPMFLHHCCTIFLVNFSFLTNFHKTITIITLVHDVSDVFLESAKVFNYMKWQKTCDTLFGFFAVSFFVCRLVLFPFYVLPSCIWDSVRLVGWFNSLQYYLYSCYILQVLHVYWFYLICRTIHRLIKDGKVEGDSREADDGIKYVRLLAHIKKELKVGKIE